MKRLSYFLTDRAYADMYAVWQYLVEKSVRASERFMTALDRTFELLCQMPRIGDRVPKHRGIRMRRVVGFGNYLVFYRLVDNRLQILRILHGARNVADLLTDPK